MKRVPNLLRLQPCLEATGAAQQAEGDWRRFASCRQADPELFFPVSSTGKSLEQAAAAKTVCARCLVRRQCLAFALRTREVHGIWGGLTAEERKQRIRDREANRDAISAPATLVALLRPEDKAGAGAERGPAPAEPGCAPIRGSA
jgi:WhiB family transcriptional regulator, redox-sensing transcriptional regulator